MPNVLPPTDADVPLPSGGSNDDPRLGTVVRITQLFLAQADPSSVLGEALELLGIAFGADRACLFRNQRESVSGRVLARPAAEWTRPGIPPRIGHPGGADLPYDLLDPALHLGLSEGRPFQAPTVELPAPSRSLFEQHGIHSLILVPIQSHDGFWGIIGFDDCTRARVWRDSEVAALQVTAATVGAALKRREVEERLQQARKMEAVGQLAGGIAHDFNNILTSILLNVGLVRTHPQLDPGARAAVGEIESEANRAAALTRQLLLFARRSFVPHRRLDLNDVLLAVLRLLRRLFADAVELRFDPALDLPPVDGDPELLEQLLVNLAVNARDAMPNGGVLSLATHVVPPDRDPSPTSPRSHPGRRVGITVADTGAGMDEAVMRRIFEPFFTTKEPGLGTGLGLAIVYSIVHQHRGWVEVESTPGQGSVFRVFLPAADDGPAIPAAAPPEVLASAVPRTILLVEDEPSVRRTIGIFLRRQGYRVLEAGSGADATRLWEAHAREIDLLFTDMVMPDGINGLELATRLRQERPGLEVIVASGYSPDLIHLDEACAGQVTFLAKPCAPALLVATVRSILEKAAAGSDGAKTHPEAASPAG